MKRRQFLGIGVVSVATITFTGCGGGGGTGAKGGSGSNSSTSYKNSWNDPNFPNMQVVNGASAATSNSPQRLDNAPASGGNQYQPRLAADQVGGAYCGWFDSRFTTETKVFGQRFDHDLALLWPSAGVQLCTSTGVQQLPAVATASDGTGWYAWEDFLRDGVNPYSHIYVQKVGLDGGIKFGGNAKLVTSVNDANHRAQRYPVLVPTNDGGMFLLAQESGTFPNRNNDNATAGWSVTRISSSGDVVWSVVICDDVTGPGAFQGYALGVPDSAGGIIVGWLTGTTSDQLNVYTQRIGSAGALQWNNGDPLAVLATANRQYELAMCSDGNGGAFYACRSNQNGVDDATGEASSDIYLQHVSASGAVSWPGGVAVCTANGIQRSPTVAYDGQTVSVAWEDLRDGGRSLYAIRLDPTTGQPVAGETANGHSLATVGNYPFPAAVADPVAGIFHYLWNSKPDSSSVPVVQYQVTNETGTNGYKPVPLAFNEQNGVTDPGRQQNVQTVWVGQGRLIIVWEQSMTDGSLKIFGRAPSAEDATF